MFNFSRKDTEFFDLFLKKAQYFHTGAVMLDEISGFAADLNSSCVVFGATLLHLPVSTTHVVSGSIMGVGTAKRVNAVHWGVAQQMVKAWIMTIPCTAAMGAGVFAIVDLIF